MKDIPISPRLKEIKRKHRVRNIWILILSFIFFISLIWSMSYFSKDKRITIKDVVINGTNIINWGEVETVVRNDISGKYLYLFSKSNSFIYPRNKIKKDLKKKFPRIEEIEVSTDGLNTITLNIKERIGTYLYCGETIPYDTVDVGENCFFVNQEGYIFDKAPYFSGDIYFKYYLSLEEKGDLKGRYLMEKEDFFRITSFVDNIESLGLKPVYIVIENDGLHSLYLEHKPTSISPKIIFRKEESLDKIFENLSIAMKEKEFANEINSKYDKLLYIDLRFKNKVLYKFE